jgi:mannitol/fructose-specific phosphotransferase system IIA component (Ntr-type)
VHFYSLHLLVYAISLLQQIAQNIDKRYAKRSTSVMFIAIPHSENIVYRRI